MTKVWLVLITVVIGILQFLDTGLYTYLAYNLNVDSVYLGFLSACWSLTYILTNYVMGGLADEGHNKLLTLISCITAISVATLLNNLNEVNGLIAYSLHALTLAVINLAASVTILEIYDHFNWNTINSSVRVLSNLIMGVLFLVAAFGTVSVSLICYVTALIALSLMILLPGVGINLERSLYRINKELSSISRYIKASTAVLYLHRPREAYEFFERVWGSETISSKRILLATSLYVMFSDLISVLVPLIMKPSIGLHGIYLSWGVAFLIATILMVFILPTASCSAKLTALLVFSRALILLALLPLINNTYSLMAYLISLVVLGTLINASLYNIYVDASSGYGTSRYFISRELGSILGSIMGGFIFMYMPSLLPIVVLVLAFTSTLLLFA